MWLWWSTYGLIRETVSLWGWALRFPMLRKLPSVSVNFLLPARQRTQPLLPQHICIHATMLPNMMIRIIEPLKLQSEPPQLNIFFRRVVMVMMSLHSNRIPKTGVGTRDWGIAMIGQTMFLFGGIWTLVLWVRERVDILSTA